MYGMGSQSMQTFILQVAYRGMERFETDRDDIAFDTQAASILKVKGSEGMTYLYVGDRWMDPGLPESKTIVFPVSFKDGECTFEYKPKFEMNFKTGKWRESNSN